MWVRAFFILVLAGTANAEAPFWKSKEKAYNRIQNREVLVVVKGSPAEKGRKRLTIQGGGQVNAPADFVFKKALEFEQLPKLTDYIQEAKFDEQTRELDIQVKAFTFKAAMKMAIEVDDKSTPKSISYVLVNGPMKGLRGVFSFYPLSEKKSEVGIDGDMLYDRFPVPKIFLQFGMEVIFQRMALRLREHAESEYKKAMP